MAQDYTPKHFLRQVPNALLKIYFHRRGVLASFDFDGIEETEVEALYDAWQALDATTREAIESDFRQIDEMATGEGVRAIVEEGTFHGRDLAQELEHRDGFHHKVMWAFLEHHAMFQVAATISWADSLSGRYRRKRKDFPKKQPDNSDAAKKNLCDAVSALYLTRQGRGRNCAVDVYPRGDRRHYYILYPEDYANTFIGFDGAKLVRRPQQPAFDLVFVYDAVDGTLELWAQGDADLRQDLQAVFGETILHERIGPETMNSIPYDIGDLKRRAFTFPLLPTDGIASVKVRSLRLATKGNKRRRITLDGDVRSNPADVYDLMDTALHEQRLPLANVDVEHASIQVEMQAVNGGRAKRFTFGISSNSCSLKEKPEHLAVAACFKRWNIARV